MIYSVNTFLYGLDDDHVHTITIHIVLFSRSDITNHAIFIGYWICMEIYFVWRNCFDTQGTIQEIQPQLENHTWLGCM